MMRVQAEATQQLSSVQSDIRVSYGNDALMPPDSTPSVDSVDLEQDNLGFIHPESFNQANTDNHGTLNSHHGCWTWQPQWPELHYRSRDKLLILSLHTETAQQLTGFGQVLMSLYALNLTR